MSQTTLCLPTRLGPPRGTWLITLTVATLLTFKKHRAQQAMTTCHSLACCVNQVLTSRWIILRETSRTILGHQVTEEGIKTSIICPILPASLPSSQLKSITSLSRMAKESEVALGSSTTAISRGTTQPRDQIIVKTIINQVEIKINGSSLQTLPISTVLISQTTCMISFRLMTIARTSLRTLISTISKGL